MSRGCTKPAKDGTSDKQAYSFSGSRDNNNFNLNLDLHRRLKYSLPQETQHSGTSTLSVNNECHVTTLTSPTRLQSTPLQIHPSLNNLTTIRNNGRRIEDRSWLCPLG